MPSVIGDSTSTSSTLLERVRARDSSAWQRLSKIYGPLVYYWSRKCGLGCEDSADVTQEVFRAVFLGISEFRHDRPGDSFRGWLRTITRNKIRDLIRRQSQQVQTVCVADGYESFMAEPIDDGEDAPPSAVEVHIVLQRVLELIRLEFEESTWQAFWQTTIDNASPRDVARALGMSVVAVYQAKSRVLKRLRNELG